MAMCFASEIREAVQEEREAIAHWLANDFIGYDEDQHPDVVCDLAAAAIRNRGLGIGPDTVVGQTNRIGGELK